MVKIGSTVLMNPVLIVADNLQITNPVIAGAVDALDAKPVRSLVRKMIDCGAEAIDINSGPLSRDAETRMTFLVECVRSETNLPVLIDTTNPKAMKAGLDRAGGRVILNGFSLEPQKLSAILPLAVSAGVEIVGYLLYPNGHVPPDGDERMSVALELYETCMAQGLLAHQLIIDPIVAPLLWGDGNRQNTEILAVLKRLPDLLGHEVSTIAGLSNLTTGRKTGRETTVIETGFAGMLAGTGLTMALVNVFHTQTVELLKACKAITKPGIFSWEAS